MITAFRQELDAWRLSRYGEPVRWTPSGYLSLAGRDGLWLVAEGELDLFAYGRSRSHFLGRLCAGGLVPASAPGTECVLAARALPGCALRRLPADELIAAPWSVAPPGPEGAEEALARGVDAGLAPLLSAVDGTPLAGTPTLVPGCRVELRPGDAARPVHGIVWLRVLDGRIGEHGPGAVLATDDTVCSDRGAVVDADTTEGLLTSGVLWPHLAAEELRLRHALARRIDAVQRSSASRPPSAMSTAAVTRSTHRRARR